MQAAVQRVSYLKKTNLYNLVKKNFYHDLMPKCKYCSYKFYRGSEWLYFTVYDGSFCKGVKIYCEHNSSKARLRVTEYDDDDVAIRDDLVYLDLEV